MAEIVPDAHSDDLSLERRELLHILSHFIELHLHVDIMGDVGAIGELPHVIDILCFFSCAKVIDDVIACDLKEPRAIAGFFRVVLLPFGECFHPYLGGQVFCCLSVPDAFHDEAKEDVGVLVIESSEDVGVAGVDEIDLWCAVHVHALVYTGWLAKGNIKVFMIFKVNGVV